MFKTIAFSTVLLVCSALSGFAQKTIHLSGTVNDVKNNPIQDAHVHDVEKKFNTTTDKNGIYSIEIPFDTCTIVISHVSFHPETIRITERNLNISMNLNVILEPKDYIIDEVEVSDIRKVYDIPNVYITDYEIRNEHIYFLMYQGNKEFIKLIDISGNEIAALELNIKKPEKLFKDCFGKIHIITPDSIYQLSFNKELYIRYSTNIGEFNKYLKKCVLYKNHCLFFQELGFHNQFVLFKIFDTHNKKSEILHTIFDTANLYIAESMLNEIQLFERGGLNRMGEIWLPDLAAIRDNEEHKIYLNQVVTMPDYNPLLFINDSIFLFDHVNHEICVYDTTGKFERRVKIAYHQYGHWAKELIVTEDHSKVYAKYVRNGHTYLNEVNLNNGKLVDRIELDKNTFPSKIKIKGDFVYYLYRDIYDTKNSKHIYKQIIY